MTAHDALWLAIGIIAGLDLAGMLYLILTELATRRTSRQGRA